MGFFSRLKGDTDKLKAATGWNFGKDFADDIAGMGRRQYKSFKNSRELLDKNLEDEDRLLKSGFGETLAAWNIEPSQLPDYIRAKTREMWCGIGLAFFAALADIAQLFTRKPGTFVFMLSTAAALSIFCCGILMAMAAAWRRSVCRNRKFVPFLVWLKDFFFKP